MRRTAGRALLVATLLALVSGAVPHGAASASASAPASASASTEPAITSHRPCGEWGSYGRVPARTFEYDCPSAISPATASTLAPLWTFKTDMTVTASPVVAGGRVFVGDWSATMHAVDADTGTELWRFGAHDAPGAPFGPIVASAAVVDIGAGRSLVVFGSGPTMHALDAATGEEVWSTYVGSAASPAEHPADEQTEFESSPVVVEGVVYSGLDVHNRTTEANNGVRGGVLAFDVRTGAVLGRFDPEHDFVDPGTGAQLSGCSSVWSSVTVDVATATLFFATGNCPHDLPDGAVWGRHIEAVTAIELDPSTWDDPASATRWTYTPEPLNRDDTDFGATPNLFRDGTGRQLLGIGKKDAVYYAFDPATGELLWSTQVTEPGNFGEDFAVGGFIGSTATGRGGVFGGTAIAPAVPYFHALDADDGAVRWTGVAGPTYAASAFVNNVVIAGALDNELKAWDARTGQLLWAFPLAGPISSGPAVTTDRVYVGSGTSSSDLCAKDQPGGDACLAVFEEAAGRTGGVHAFALAAPGEHGAVAGTATGSALWSNEGGRLWRHDTATLERAVTSWTDPGGQVCVGPAGAPLATAGATGCAVLPDGRVVVARDGALHVDGCEVAAVEGPLAVDEAGRLLAVAGGTVLRFPSLACGGSPSEDLGGLAATAAAATGRGTLYVGSQTGTITEVAGDGAPLGVVVPAGAAVTGLAVDVDGALYWTAADGTLRRLVRGGTPEVLNAGTDAASSVTVAPVAAQPEATPGGIASPAPAGETPAPATLPATGSTGAAGVAVAVAAVSWCLRRVSRPTVRTRTHD